MLLAFAASAAEDLPYEARDGSFPEHGSCTFLGPHDDETVLGGAASDLAAAQARTWQTLRAVASISSPAGSGFRIPPAFRDRGRAVGPVACAGIDDCIARTAQSAGVPITHGTTDAEFLRRVRLDLTGRIPVPEEVLAFLADTSPDKRARLVDRLLETPEWADRWTMFFGDLYRNTNRNAQVNRYPDTRDSFHLFLLESLQRNKPYDQMVREILSAEGTSDGRTYPEEYTSYEHFQSTYGDRQSNPVQPSAVGYIVGGLTTGGPIQDTYDTLAFFTARDFLGISTMDCVLCHDGEGHLESVSVWGTEAKRLEGWQLAAFFSDLPRYQTWRVRRNTLPNDPRTGRRVQANYRFIHDLAPGLQQRTRGGDTAGDYLAQTAGGNRPDRAYRQQYILPSYPFAGSASVSPGMRLREQLGVHLTADPQFARATVNYIWKQFFSRGFVEPADQFDLARLDPSVLPPGDWEIQPSHPDLLEWLAKRFQENGFDLRWLMREITTSRSYQLSSRYEGVFNPLEEKYFVRHQVKRLSAEQVHDAVAVATGILATYNVSRTMRGLQFALQFPDVVNMPPGQAIGRRNARMLLDSFTRGDRDQTARSSTGSPLQALNLMNNPLIMNRIAPGAGQGTLHESLQLPDDGLVSSLYLSVLSRPPTNDELAFGVDYIRSGGRGAKAANLMWALLNKTDFYFNY